MVPASMTQYHRLKRKQLSDLLVDERLATKEVVIAGLHEHRNSKAMLSTILLESQELDAFGLAKLMVEQYQVPFVDLERYLVQKDLIARFPAELLHRARIVPLDEFGPNVSFACQEVPSREVHDELKQVVMGSVLIFAAFARDIESVLHQHAPYTSPETTQRIEDVGIQDVAEIADEELTATELDWQSLFDAADEAIVSDLDVPADE